MTRLIALVLLTAGLFVAAGCAGAFDSAKWGPKPACGWEFYPEGCNASSWPYGYRGGF